jgi:hypothetical protein
MIALRDFFERLRQINDGSRGADKIKISNSSGEPVNLVKNGDTFSISQEQKETADKFLNVLSDLTGWDYQKNKWTFDNFSVYKFKKGNIKPSNQRFNELIEKNPLSWAMTSTLAIEYTLEEPSNLP